MKRILFTILMLWSIAYGQSTIYIRGDTVRMQKGGGNATLVVENATRNVVGGVLTNTGGGRTQFVLPQGNEIDVFLIGGQSNMRGVGDSAGSPNPQPGTVYQYDAGVFEQVTNEVGHLPSGRGSLFPTFGINWHRLTARKVCFIQRAVDGSGQMVLSDVGFGNWGPSGTLFQMSLDTLNAALAAITAAGYQPVFRGVIWGQGENDARKINSATITKQQYKDTLTNMIARYRTALGSDMPFYIYQTGTETVTSDVGYDSVRQAQAEVVAANPLRNKMISTNAFDFAARSLLNLDGLHWSQTALNEQGTVGPVNIVDGLDLQWQRSGTSLSYILGRVGVGIKLPAFPFHVATTTGDVAKFAGNGNGLMSLWMENTNGGSSAGDAIRFSNNLGFGAQIAYGSSTNAFTPNGLLMHPFTGDYWMGANAGNLYFFTGATGPLLANIKAVITQAGSFGVGSTPVASAILDVGSTSKGALLPRMTSAQRTGISSPATGLITFDTDSSAYFFYSGSVWIKMSGSGGGGGTSYTFSTGLTNSSGTVTNNLSTGISGGQAAIGGTAADNVLTLNGNNAASSNTASSPNIKFGVGNSGSTVAGQIHNNGVWAFGVVSNSDANTFRHVINQIDNTATNGAIYYPNANTSTYLQIGYGAILTNNSTFSISNTGGGIRLNTTVGVFMRGTTTPTASMQTPAQTTSAGTGQWKMTGSATIMSTPEDGAWEYDGLNPRFTNAAGRGYVVPSLIYTGSDVSLSITMGYSDYFYNGSGGGTWSLPTVTGTTGQVITVANVGSGSVTVNVTGGGSTIFTTTTASSVSVGVGAVRKFVSNGTYWKQYILD